MRVEPVQTVFPRIKKPQPPIIFVGNIFPVTCGYLLGSITGITIMDYLAKLALMNKYYHTGQMGVYER